MMLSPILLSALLFSPCQSVEVVGSGARQESPLPHGIRKRMTGRLVQRDGKAWAGALVRLISWPDWNYPGVGTFDDLRVQTDERGLFRVQGLQHRRYYVWAWQAAGDHAYRVSVPGEYLRPGQPFVLKEQGRTVRKQLVTVDVQSWSRFGPFRIAVRENPFFGSHYRSVSQQLNLLPWMWARLVPETSVESASGASIKKMELPVLPWPHVRVEILGKGGLLLFQKSLSLETAGEGPAEHRLSAGKAKQSHARFYLDERLTKRAKGYKLYQRYMGRLVELGDVDEDGQGRILLPGAPRRTYDNYWYERNPRYVARLEGRAEASDYNLQRMTRVGAERGMRIAGAMGVLQAGHELQLQVQSAEGKALAGLPILVWQRERLPRLLRKVHVLPTTLIRTDQQGRLRYPWLSLEEFALFAILPDELLDQLMGESKVPIHPMVLLHRGLGIGVRSSKKFVIRVDQLQRVDFEIAWDKEKVRESPVVNLFSPQADNYGFLRLLRLFCDRRGRARALIPRVHKLNYLVRSPLGVVGGSVVSRADGDSTPLVIGGRIPDAVEISGRIMDAKGNPVTSAGLSLANPWFRARYQDPLLRFDLARVSTMVDEQGRFRMFQEKVRAPLQLYVQVFRGEKALKRTVHSLDADGKLTGLEIEVTGFDAVPTPPVRRGVPMPRVRRVPLKKK